MKTIHITIPKLKQRVTWGFNPVTRTVKAKKNYSRVAFKKELRHLQNQKD